MTNLVFSSRQYELNPQTEHVLLTILAGGGFSTDAPIHILSQNIPCDNSLLMLYTQRGLASLCTPSGLLDLAAGSLLFLPYDPAITLERKSSDWSGAYFLLSDSYFSRLPISGQTRSKSTKNLFFLPADSRIPGYLEHLSLGQAGASLHNKLYDHKLLTSILCDTLLQLPEALKTPKAPPAYLIRMKQILEEGYAFPHSLAEFESLFEISRYRLCREFTNTYGDSPMQYLNKLRIEKSLQLLRDTDLNIRETGCAVGIENTNHFINLFKKYTGKTPLVYRQNCQLFF